MFNQNLIIYLITARQKFALFPAELPKSLLRARLYLSTLPITPLLARSTRSCQICDQCLGNRLLFLSTESYTLTLWQAQFKGRRSVPRPLRSLF
jgi:hypothetical protein